MPTFSEITLEEAKQIIGGLVDEDAKVSQAYYNGDAWQDGNAWVGPRPAEGDTGAADVLEEIQDGLVSKNVIAETVHRHRDALIGQEPDWSLVPRRPLGRTPDPDNPEKTPPGEPNDEEKRLIDEANAALVDWWDGQQALMLIQEATANLLISSYKKSEKAKDARACLRLFVPPALVDDKGMVKNRPSLADALSLIFPHAPELFTSTVYVDPDSQQRIGLYAFTVKGLASAPAENRLEMHGLDDARQTLIKIYEDAKEKPSQSAALQLGGNLGIFEMVRERFITPQIQQLQALANMALTMMGRNVVLGGFLERVILNASLPGKMVDDPDRPGKTIFQPQPYKVGPSATNVLTGNAIYGDPNNKSIITGYTNPNVVYRDPVDVKCFVDTLAEAYGAILDETKQTHSLISKDATASGESRKQAAAEFLKSLNSTKTQIEAAGRWMIETALAMAAQFAGTPGRYAGLRAQFQCNVDIGPMTSEEQKTIISLKREKIISTSTAMQRVGVDDPEAESAKIATEQTEADARAVNQASALAAIAKPEPTDPNKPQPTKGDDV